MAAFALFWAYGVPVGLAIVLIVALWMFCFKRSEIKEPEIEEESMNYEDFKTFDRKHPTRLKPTPYVRRSAGYRRNTDSPPMAPQSEDNDPLLGGVIGYLTTSHGDEDAICSPNRESQSFSGGGGSFGGGGASGSFDDTPSSGSVSESSSTGLATSDTSGCSESLGSSGSDDSASSSGSCGSDGGGTSE
jgi:uncharacterized membrane protein YgcG